MTSCFFASDLHGDVSRYGKLIAAIENETPDIVLLGGDLLPPFLDSSDGDTHSDSGFIDGFLRRQFLFLKSSLGQNYPAVFIIPGNDDPKSEEESLEHAGRDGLWANIQGRVIQMGNYAFAGYAFIPPTPFRLKDWERYDVSRFVDPGCTPPEEGTLTTNADRRELSRRTIQNDLEILGRGMDFSKTVFLFHSPPYDTYLDRAALDGKMFDSAPLDVHVGSIAIKRFLEKTQPLISLHGHVHESAELSGSWKELIGRTHCFGAAHAGPELALVRFNLEDPAAASRDLL